MRRTALLAPVALFLVALVGCSADSAHDPIGTGEPEFSSNQATLLDFEFDAELLADFSFDDKQTIEGQLLYTIGHLNADNSVGRLDKVALSNIKKTQVGAQTKIAYHAKLPVAWGGKTNLPSTYKLQLPKDVSSKGLETFTEAHKAACVDFGAHEVDTGSMWYYFRPHRSGCQIKPEEIIEVVATSRVSTENTTAKFPEYHKVWEDNRLEIVAIFGKYESGGKAGDAGVEGFNQYVAMMKRELRAVSSTVATVPADASDAPAPAVADVSFEATLSDGKVVKVTALLVDAITEVPAGFNERYESLTPTADVIAYNGHAGLGQNVRALAQMGRWVPAKYQMFFMNGCDTFAYVDGSLAQTRAKLNPDDPTGTKYMEFVTNAMPSFFSSMPSASTALMKGLLSYAKPMTYDQMFANIDRHEVVLVTGEEDNVFQPGMPIGKAGGGGGSTFKGFEESGTLARNIEKASSFDVPAGTYLVELTGDGDADLYVRKGTAPTQKLFDCRPFANGSNEKCTVTFSEPGKLNVMVRGFAATSSYKLVGKQQ